MANLGLASVGTDTFSVTTVFNEPMNTTLRRHFVPDEDLGSTLAFDASASGWTSSTTYVAAKCNRYQPDADQRGRESREPRAAAALTCKRT